MNIPINKTLRLASAVLLFFSLTLLSGCNEEDEYGNKLEYTDPLLSVEDMCIELPAEGGEIEINKNAGCKLDFYLAAITSEKRWEILPTNKEGHYYVKVLENYTPTTEYIDPSKPDQIFTVDNITLEVHPDKLKISASENTSGKEQSLYAAFHECIWYIKTDNNAIEIHQPSL